MTDRTSHQPARAAGYLAHRARKGNDRNHRQSLFLCSYCIKY